VVYWVPPGANWVEHYVVVPDAGSINGGKPGALIGPGFGVSGTPEDGFLFVASMFNCCMYKVTSKRQIWPFIIGDAAHSGIQFMPRFLYRAPEGWGRHTGELICEGVANHSFASAAPMPGGKLIEEQIVHFVVRDQGEGRLADVTQIDAAGLPPVQDVHHPGWIAGIYKGGRAPEGFGRFGGQMFSTDIGTVNLKQTTQMPDGALPYDASVYRIDERGERRPFVVGVQGGYPHLQFQDDRMLIASMGKSYSTGDFHYPDGYLAEVVYVGEERQA